MSLIDLSKIVKKKSNHNQIHEASDSQVRVPPFPDFNIQYCFGCQEMRKYVHQSFELNGKRYDNYICEYCGRTER
jgi:aspartate carbamoyltransferase regulatory subunit